MNILQKKLDKPNTYLNFFDKLNNFSIYSIDELFKLYENQSIKLVEAGKVNKEFTVDKMYSNNDYNYQYKFSYDKSVLKSDLTNYNGWSYGLETGLLKKQEYLDQKNNNLFSGNFIYFNIPHEIFNLFSFFPNSDIGVIRYFVNYINENDKWNDLEFVNKKIDELDKLVPNWNHNFPIFIYKDILEKGLVMPLSNNHDTFLAGGIHRYICQSLCKRPTPIFVKIPHINYKGDLNNSRFINNDEFILPSNFPLFTKPSGSYLLDYIVFKINIKTQIIKFYLTPKRSKEINDDCIEIGYCDYKTDTYELYGIE